MQSSSEQGKFRTWDGLDLFYRLYPVQEANDGLVLLHGMGEHSGRYEKFPVQLQDQKISIAAFDLRGHGRSDGENVYVDSFEQYLKDVTAFFDFLREKLGPGKRIYLFGHSLGGLIAVQYALRFPETIHALILSSPCLGLMLSGLLQGFNRCLNNWAPHYQYRNPVYPPHLTHDQSEVERYKKDGLILRKISVRLLNEMLEAMNQIQTQKTFLFNFLVYIVMAGDEKVVDGKETKAFYGKIQSPVKELKVMPGFYHEVFNETGQAQAFKLLREEVAAIRRYYASAR